MINVDRTNEAVDFIRIPKRKELHPLIEMLAEWEVYALLGAGSVKAASL
jgi:hypothetical protein